MACPVPTTQGMPSSRLTIAACAVLPPRSVTIAAARFIAGTKSGVVISATRTSPCFTLSIWEASGTIFTAPEAMPGLAGAPDRSTGCVISATVSASAFIVVTGRVWTIKISSPSIAHSKSWGNWYSSSMYFPILATAIMSSSANFC